MECKVVPISPLIFTPFHWNISRMECKADLIHLLQELLLIGIYPEWNVKAESVQMERMWQMDWNISRMECKVE